MYMDNIIIDNLVFYAYHGALEEEKRLGQRFHIDLNCGLDLSVVSQSDELKDTVCYTKLVETVDHIVSNFQFKLIERLAGAIIDEIFKLDPRIMEIKIRIHKPSAPLPRSTGKVSVELSRIREVKQKTNYI